MTITDLTVGWRLFPYVFLDVLATEDQQGEAGEVEIALVSLTDESHFVAATEGHTIDWKDHSARICSSIEGIVRGRVVVSHGTAHSWRWLDRQCPSLHPLAVLDSLRLARALLPGCDMSLAALMRRLDVTPSEPDVSSLGQMAAHQRAVALARTFEQLITRMRPNATLSSLLHLAETGTADSISTLGLESGR